MAEVPVMRRPVLGLGRRLMALLCAVAVLVALPGGTACKQEESSDRLTVVATIFPLADFVKNVAGDRVDVITLLRPGDSPPALPCSSTLPGCW